MHKHAATSLIPHSQTITVKLRNTNTTPPTTRLFHLPKSRALSTSAYFSQHSKAHTPSHRPQRDPIVRLNFPDFDIFGIYAEWLHSGELFSKAGLCQLQQTTDIGNPISPERKARAAYTDYLGCYFLGCWLQDTVFKDALVSLTIERMNDSEIGYPEQFVRALKPSLVNLVVTDERGSKGIRMLMYAAIARWGTEADMERLVPSEGTTCERGFVRELMAYLLLAGRNGGNRNADGKKGEEMDGRTDMREDEAELWTTASTTTPEPGEMGLSRAPPPFMPRMEDMWMPASHVSWPTSASGTEAASRHETTTIVATSSATSISSSPRNIPVETYVQLGWPEQEQDHCLFHEHMYLKMECHRKTARWDVETQKWCYGATFP